MMKRYMMRLHAIILLFLLIFVSVFAQFRYSNAVTKPDRVEIEKAKVTKSSGKITMKWPKVPGASGYEVKKAMLHHKMKKFKTINKNTPKFTDKNVLAGVTYEYILRAYKSDNGKKVYGKWEEIEVRAKTVKEKTIPSSVWKDVLDREEKLKSDILESESYIVKNKEFIPGKTYTGTAYYISNNGDDSNDGLSSDTPLATLDKLTTKDLRYGDAVFLERGSVFRGKEVSYNKMMETPGITYSAYGTGDKPGLYGSSENGVGEDKWKLYSEKDGKKIWVFYKDMTDVAAVVADEKTIIKRDLAWWSGSKYYTVRGLCELTATNKVYKVENELPDMYCFPDLRYTDEQYHHEPVYRRGWWSTENGIDEFAMGKLYLRCDAGNPGELYRSIEFIQPYSLEIPLDGLPDETVLDNIKISYSSGSCTGGNIGDRNKGGVIQNCEISYNGGHVYSYSFKKKNEYNAGVLQRMGDCLGLNGSDYSIKHNYIHHGYQCGITIETFKGDKTLQNDIIENNLIEKCVCLAQFINWENHNKNHIYKDFVIKNNIMLYAGKENFFRNPKTISTGAEYCFCFGFSCYSGCKNVKISNNIFGLTEYKKNHGVLFVNDYISDYIKVFSNNTYIQKKGYRWMFADYPIERSGPITNASFTKANVKYFFGDSKAKVYRK